MPPLSRLCPKCSAVNTQATGDTDEACPACGVIYTRYATAAAALIKAEAARQTRSQASPKKTELSSRGIMEGVGWAMTLLGSFAGLWLLGSTWLHATSAPQQAAGAGLALACAVIPYCFARALQMVSRPSRAG